MNEPKAPYAGRLPRGKRFGRYEILDLLGSGGIGEVYRARDTSLSREVALKILTAEATRDSVRFRRFQTEAQASAALSHPNIVSIYDVGEEGGTPYIVSELVEGTTLAAALARGPFPTKRLLDLAVGIAEGLAAAHAQGIVHRDLKPSNVLLTAGGVPKIADFGLAKYFRASSDFEGSHLSTLPDERTAEGTILGTVGYMSPEQAKGEAADFRSDQFSLGSILYEMTTGRRAFQRTSLVQTLAAIVQEEPEQVGVLNPKTPAPLSWIVERCLAKEPRARYAATEDLARELQTVRNHLSETSISGETIPKPDLLRLAIRKTALIVALVLAALVAGLLVGRRTVKVSPPVFQRLTFRRGNVGQARFAPDGQTIVYGARWDNQPWDVFTTRLDSPQSRSLGIADLLGLYSVSSLGEIAGSWLPGRKGNWLLARVPLAGGTPRALLENVSAADWSPDGARLAVAHRVGSRVRLEFPIGKVLYEGTSIWYLRVSPKGDLVAFDDHPFTGTSAAMVMVADASGKSSKLLDREGVTGLQWSPNGREIWYSGGARDALYAVTLAGEKRLLHQSAGRLYLTDVSRDGRALVHQDNWRNGIVARLVGESGESDVSWMANSQIADISADARTLLFYDGGKGEGWEGAGGFSGVYLRKLGEPAVHLGPGNPMALSPDGKWALSGVNGNTQLVLLPTGPGEPRPLRNENLVYQGWARFLPDGKRIVFAANEPGHGSRCWVQGLEKGDRHPVTPEGVWPRWGPDDPILIGDGRSISVYADRKFLLYPVDGGQPREIPFLSAGEKGEPDAETPSLVQSSPDGRYLYLRKDSTPIQISRLDLSTGRREPWLEITPPDRVGLSVRKILLSADGKSYVYGYDRRLSDLYLVEGLK